MIGVRWHAPAQEINAPPSSARQTTPADPRPTRARVSTRQEMASAVSAGNPNSAPKRTKLPSSAPNAPGSMNAAARTPEPRLSRINASIMPRGFPKACITNDTSPASAAHPIRRKTLACSMIGPVRYAATIASSIADAPPANAGTHGANSAHHEFAAPERHRL